eukprot:11159237-Lingulodinium_polyedra.AAC.1
MLLDLIKGCEGSTLLINDFLAGIGELGVAAVRARCPQEAKDAGVRVCYWGLSRSEHRRRLRGQTSILSLGSFPCEPMACSGLAVDPCGSPSAGLWRQREAKQGSHCARVGRQACEAVADSR